MTEKARVYVRVYAGVYKVYARVYKVYPRLYKMYARVYATVYRYTQLLIYTNVDIQLCGLFEDFERTL